jgi:hypothetical protein
MGRSVWAWVDSNHRPHASVNTRAPPWMRGSSTWDGPGWTRTTDLTLIRPDSGASQRWWALAPPLAPLLLTAPALNAFLSFHCVAGTLDPRVDVDSCAARIVQPHGDEVPAIRQGPAESRCAAARGVRSCFFREVRERLCNGKGHSERTARAVVSPGRDSPVCSASMRARSGAGSAESGRREKTTLGGSNPYLLGEEPGSGWYLLRLSGGALETPADSERGGELLCRGARSDNGGETPEEGRQRHGVDRRVPTVAGAAVPASDAPEVLPICGRGGEIRRR